jgi:hypothetical protein
MRTIAIIHDQSNQRPWLAIDRETRQQLLRLADRDQLLRTCERLGWRLVTEKIREARRRRA